MKKSQTSSGRSTGRISSSKKPRSKKKKTKSPSAYAKARKASYSEGLRIARAIRTQIHALDNRQGHERPVGDSFTGTVAKAVNRQLGQRPSQNHHLDHIIPLSWWDAHDIKQLKLCWHVKNLRWLYGPSNSARGNRVSRDEFDRFSSWHKSRVRRASYRPDYVNQWF